MIAARSREDLERGLQASFQGAALSLSAEGDDIRLCVDGEPALLESKLTISASRSAWNHAWIALAASFFGFLAGYLYLVKAQTLNDAWAMKMSLHMAGWHLLLTLTLFPASAWGQRIGIRTVQVMSFVFFCIHVGIALANVGTPDDVLIAALNAASGVCFAAAVVYGQRAYRDMDPLAALPGSD